MGPLAQFGLDGYPWTGPYLRFTLLNEWGGGSLPFPGAWVDPCIHQQNPNPLEI